MAMVFFYHVLNFMIIGPLTYFVVVLFSGHNYALNSAFGFRKTMMSFFII
jgi:hypothetical protein